MACFCQNPFIIRVPHEIAVPCGRCALCRVRRKEDWTARLYMESACYKSVAFATLTYDEENLPRLVTTGMQTLNYTDVQLFLKRLRKKLNYQIRFFCAGEYGSKTFRPHYHLLIFGLKLEDFSKIDECWQKGITEVDYADKGGIKYVCGYVNKKWNTGAVQKLYLNDALPEFVQMSKGIGRNFVIALSEAFIKDKMIQKGLFPGVDDIVDYITIDGEKVKIPKYVKQKLREKVFSPEQLTELKRNLLNASTFAHEEVMACHLGIQIENPGFDIMEHYKNYWHSQYYRIIQYAEIRKHKEKI